MIGFLAGLAAAVLVVLAMAVLGEYTKTRGRFFLTALTLAGFSLASLGPSALHQRGTFPPVAGAGLLAPLLGFTLVVAGLWATPDSDGFWKATAVASLLAVSLTNVCWMLLLVRRSILISAMVWTSAGGASLMALLSSAGIILEVKSPPYWWAVSLIVIVQLATGIASQVAHWWSRPGLQSGRYCPTSNRAESGSPMASSANNARVLTTHG